MHTIHAHACHARHHPLHPAEAASAHSFLQSVSHACVRACVHAHVHGVPEDGLRRRASAAEAAVVRARAGRWRARGRAAPPAPPLPPLFRLPTRARPRPPPRGRREWGYRRSRPLKVQWAKVRGRARASGPPRRALRPPASCRSALHAARRRTTRQLTQPATPSPRERPSSGTRPGPDLPTARPPPRAAPRPAPRKWRSPRPTSSPAARCSWSTLT